MYKVRGIPTLVFLDGETGEVINTDGRSIVTSDPEGKEYPWPRPTFAEAMQGVKLINNKKEEFDVPKALDGKVRGLYFSAHWVG
jgi:nucleoredoxin